MSFMSAHPRTDETAFIGTFPDLSQRGAIRSYISINVAAVTRDIREALADWDNLDLDDLLPTAPFGRPTAYPADEVAAVEFIEGVLGVTAERIFAATDVKPRTYYGWREGTRKPRASSVGSLWSAVEALYYLAQSHPNLVAWFNDNPEAQRLFDAGDFASLARLEVDWLIRTRGGSAPTMAPYTHLEDVAAGPTREASGGRRTHIEARPVPITRIKAPARRSND